MPNRVQTCPRQRASSAAPSQARGRGGEFGGEAETSCSALFGSSVLEYDAASTSCTSWSYQGPALEILLRAADAACLRRVPAIYRCGEAIVTNTYGRRDSSQDCDRTDVIRHDQNKIMSTGTW